MSFSFLKSIFVSIPILVTAKTSLSLKIPAKKPKKETLKKNHNDVGRNLKTSVKNKSGSEAEMIQRPEWLVPVQTTLSRV